MRATGEPRAATKAAAILHVAQHTGLKPIGVNPNFSISYTACHKDIQYPCSANLSSVHLITVNTVKTSSGIDLEPPLGGPGRIHGSPAAFFVSGPHGPLRIDGKHLLILVLDVVAKRQHQ